MPLKKPGDLFNSNKNAPKESSIDLDGNIPNIKEEFDKVEDLREQLNNVSSSLNNSLTEVVNKNLNFLSDEYAQQLDKFNNKIDKFKEEIVYKVNNLKKSNSDLKADIQIVEQRQNKINITVITEEVLSGVQDVLSGNLEENIKKLEDKIEIIKEAYEENILKEGLLNEPPSTDNEDPLTPLDKNYATLEDLNKHYRSFINRVQIQLSTIGGGGAVNIKDMDDVDSSALSNGKVLEYDSTLKKWKGGSVSGTVGNVVGVSTFNDDVKFNGNTSGFLWDHSKNDLIFYNNTRLELGSNTDFQMWHGGTHTFMKNIGGDLRIRGNKILLKREDDSERYIECNVNNDVKLFYNGVEKFATTLEGVSVTGLTTTTNLYVTGVSTFSHNIVAENRITVEGEIYVAGNIRHTGDTDTYIEFTDDQIRLLAGGKGILQVTEASIDSVVINNGGNNCDFRVEGLNDENLIFSDGSTDRVGISSDLPRSKLDVRGDVYVGSSQAQGVILTSPNGTKYRLVVADNGTLSTSAV